MKIFLQKMVLQCLLYSTFGVKSGAHLESLTFRHLLCPILKINEVHTFPKSTFFSFVPLFSLLHDVLTTAEAVVSSYMVFPNPF